MSKIDEVRSAMVAAMKAKDKDTKETLSALLAALKNKAIDKRADLTEEEEVQVIMKEIKQVKETLEMTPEDRTDIKEECEKRLAVLEQYAPKMMDEAEIKEVIASVLSELGIAEPTGKDKGKIMKAEAESERKSGRQACQPGIDGNAEIILEYHKERCRFLSGIPLFQYTFLAAFYITADSASRSTSESTSISFSSLRKKISYITGTI